MPTFVRMARTFSYDLDNGTRRTIPAGWAGNLEDDVAQRAVDGGFTSEPEPPEGVGRTRTGEVLNEDEAPAVDNGDITPDQTDPNADQNQDQTNEQATEDMTRDQLNEMARGRGLNPDEYRTKADIVNAINAV